MDSYKLAVKIFVEDASSLHGHEFVPIFHSWIQQKKLSDHLVIDVADYEHVHDGPGTLLITFEANIATDHEDGRLGLLYIRKQPIKDAETFRHRLHAVIRPVLQAAQWLEVDATLAGKIKFRTDEFLLRIYDRLLAPNTADTFAAVKEDLAAVTTDLFGAPPLSMEFNSSSPESLFEVKVKTPGAATLGDLLAKIRQ
ncbi:MAG TPA: hypothetical protein VG326_15925 [Tepidisphaeraceae bacterium]|jgi:hypothetical protein|nr:hypothetical protein [Tepidisphaeraceae bacterium]